MLRIVLGSFAAVLVLPLCNLFADEPAPGATFVGRTQAAATIDVRSRVTGYLQSVNVKAGQLVKQGDVLAEIDSREYQLGLENARAKVKIAEAQLNLAKNNADRARKLFESKAISAPELELTIDTLRIAEAEHEVAKTEVQRAELTLSWAHLVAPRDGQVGEIPYSPGNLISKDQTPLMTIVAADPLHVVFQVPEATYLQMVRDNNRVPGHLNVAIGFAGDDGLPHTAKVDMIEPQADPQTGTIRFRASLPNPKRELVPGLTASVRLLPASK